MVGCLALLAVVGLAVLQVLAAGATAELAGHAAEAGAVAIAEGQDPRTAARRALPGWSRDGLTVHITGPRVRIHLEPPTLIPVLAPALATTAQATAGPR